MLSENGHLGCTDPTGWVLCLRGAARTKTKKTDLDGWLPSAMIWTSLLEPRGASLLAAAQRPERGASRSVGLPFRPPLLPLPGREDREIEAFGSALPVLAAA
jgi:hypothetical protein